MAESGLCQLRSTQIDDHHALGSDGAKLPAGWHWEGEQSRRGLPSREGSVSEEGRDADCQEKVTPGSGKCRRRVRSWRASGLVFSAGVRGLSPLSLWLLRAAQSKKKKRYFSKLHCPAVLTTAPWLQFSKGKCPLWKNWQAAESGCHFPSAR